MSDHGPPPLPEPERGPQHQPGPQSAPDPATAQQPPLTPSTPLTPPPLPDPGSQTAPGPQTDPGSQTDPGALGDGELAQTHITEDTRTYPCQACGGELHFDIVSQQLKCQHCGSTHAIVPDADRVVREQDLRGALSALKSGVFTSAHGDDSDEKEVICQNCGGHTTFTGSLTADRCPYCATPIQRDDVHEAPRRLAVDGVLPFRVDDRSADQLIHEWINKRWFAPTEFKKYSQAGSFASVYTAYFTYDAETSTSYRGQRGDNYTVTVGHGENRRTETRVKWHNVQGHVRNNFDDVTVFANTGLDRNRVAKLEPWPTHEAQGYTPEYIAGHLCRTYDNDVAECLPEATSVMEDAIQNTVRRDIGGDQQRISGMNIGWHNMTYKHLLLPIWLLTVIYEQKPFQVYINGVTGEVHGERPYSKVKIAAAVVVGLIVLIILITLYAAAKGGG